VDAYVLGEYEFFTRFYARLAAVLSVTNYSHHLVSAKILTTDEEEQLDTLDSSNKRAAFVLRKIAAHLKGGSSESFHALLSVIETHGDVSSISLVSEVRSGIISTTGKSTKTAIMVFDVVSQLATSYIWGKSMHVHMKSA